LNIVALWARAFCETLFIELCVAIPLLAGVGSKARRALAVGFAQLVTHPAVWFIFPTFGWSRTRYLLVAESWAVLGEFTFYRFVFETLSWPRALAVSALANAASYGVGLLLTG
jgi:hypothetical protein